MQVIHTASDNKAGRGARVRRVAEGFDVEYFTAEGSRLAKVDRYGTKGCAKDAADRFVISIGESLSNRPAYATLD